jgi:hypothetical protein
MQPRLRRIAADVGTYSIEVLAVDIDPGCPRRVRGRSQDVGAVVYTVEVNSDLLT